MGKKSKKSRIRSSNVAAQQLAEGTMAVTSAQTSAGTPADAEAETSGSAAPVRSTLQQTREYISSILIAVALAILIRTTVVQAFYIPSSSMEDSLLVGDYLLANKFVYGAPVDIIGTNIHLFRLPALRDPEPGDIVIFRSPEDENRDLIKRCVAVGGQEIKILNKVLYVDGVRFQDPPMSKFLDSRIRPARSSPRDNFATRVPKDHFFMMGDNRDNSHDSRFMDAIPRRLIKGKAMIIYWSWDASKPGLVRWLPDLVDRYFTSLPSRIRYDRLGDVIF